MVENNNSVALNNSNTFSEDEVIPLWRQIMDYRQVTQLLRHTKPFAGPRRLWLVLLKHRHLKQFVQLFFSQLAMTITGFLANLVTLITLSRNKAIFSEIIRLLLMNQSCVDCVACLFASILILQVS